MTKEWGLREQSEKQHLFIYFFLHNSLSKSNQPGVVAHTFSTRFLGDYGGKKSIEFKSLRPGWSRKGKLLSVNKTAIEESKAL